MALPLFASSHLRWVASSWAPKLITNSGNVRKCRYNSGRQWLIVDSIIMQQSSDRLLVINLIQWREVTIDTATTTTSVGPLMNALRFVHPLIVVDEQNELATMKWQLKLKLSRKPASSQNPSAIIHQRFSCQRDRTKNLNQRDKI